MNLQLDFIKKKNYNKPLTLTILYLISNNKTMEEELPRIMHENEEKTVKIIYRGGDYVYIYSGLNSIAVHLGDIEFLIDTISHL